jgi:hypothetical protein
LRVERILPGAKGASGAGQQHRAYVGPVCLLERCAQLFVHLRVEALSLSAD